MMSSKGLATATENVIGRSVFDCGISTPLMVVRSSALETNIALMVEYCRRHGVHLAPHAKTTMSPGIVQRQLAAGCWGITVANVSQAIALGDRAGKRILIANEVVDSAAIGWLNSTIAAGQIKVCCYVDSIVGVRSLAEGISSGVLDVLLEVGMPGGRCGVRTVREALQVVDALSGVQSLRLIGVAGFEGLLGADVRTVEAESSVREYLRLSHLLAADLMAAGAFEGIDEVILTAGGSAYFDIVVEEFTRPVGGKPTLVLLRSGCYVTHDHGMCAKLSPFRGADQRFNPAIEVISSVLSRPEPQLAICDIGRRDVSFDAGLPIALWIRRRKTGRMHAVSGLEIKRLNDQHAFVSMPRDALSVGDVVLFGISHPCTAFDKWRVIPLVDNDYRITELLHTMF